MSVITAGNSDDAFTLDGNDDSDDDVEDVTPRKNDGEKNEFELYSSKDGSHLDYMEGDLKEDVKSFLLPFRKKFIGTNFNQLALTEAKSIVETVDIRFVFQCATKIGAPKSWIGDK